jgi:hypothetical protein
MVSDDQSSEFTAVAEQLGAGATPKPLVLRPTEPCLFVIFGASGDLTGRKLIPALYNMAGELKCLIDDYLRKKTHNTHC